MAASKQPFERLASSQRLNHTGRQSEVNTEEGSNASHSEAFGTRSDSTAGVGRCKTCRGIDLSPLFDPLPDSTACQEDILGSHAVYVDSGTLAELLKSTKCPFCSLLRGCWERSGLSPSVPKSRWEHDDDRRNVSFWCQLLPRLKRSGDGLLPSVSLSGQLDMVLYQEFERLKDGSLPQAPKRSRMKRISNFMQQRFSRLDEDKNLRSDDRADPQSYSSRQHSPPMNSQSGSRPQNKSNGLSGYQAQKSNMGSWVIDVLDSSYGIRSYERHAVGPKCDVNMIRMWLGHCQRRHEHPAQVAGVSIPLSELNLQNHFRVINTSSGIVTPLGPNEQFAALSYVWGKEWSRKISNQGGVLGSDPSKMARGLGDYPLTIQDALQLAHDIGYEWLWVDCICIDQADAAEKALLIPFMKDIFAAADLTIIAACGEGATSGLAGIGQTSRPAEETFDISWDHGSASLVPVRESFNVYLKKATWRTRGWTFEEQVFSRRLLYVFDSEVVFSCSEGTLRESTGMAFSNSTAGSHWGDRGRTPPTIVGELHASFHAKSTGLQPRMTARHFVRAVEEYCFRDLTIEEDRAKAFAGVIAAADLGPNITQDESLLLHGHPMHLFETLLTWQREEGQKTRMTQGIPFAPTWSWAGAQSTLYFLDNGEEHTRNHLYKFSRLAGFDVLGVPTQDHNLPSFRFPSDILDAAPWRKHTEELPPEYDTVVDLPYPQSKALDLPILHLVTIIFDAYFVPTNGEQHCLRPLGHVEDERASTRLAYGRWSVTPATEISQVRIPFKRSFALVGGNDRHLYLMLLIPGLFPDTYTRGGLSRASVFDISLRVVLATGNAKWQYIRIK